MIGLGDDAISNAFPLVYSVPCCSNSILLSSTFISMPKCLFHVSQRKSADSCYLAWLIRHAPKHNEQYGRYRTGCSTASLRTSMSGSQTAGCSGRIFMHNVLNGYVVIA